MALSCREFHEPTDNTGIKDRIVGILTVDLIFWACIIEQFGFPQGSAAIAARLLSFAIATAMWFLKFIIGTSELYTHHCIVVIFNRSFLKHYPMYINLFYAVICRFVLAPLAMFTFLAH